MWCRRLHRLNLQAFDLMMMEVISVFNNASIQQ
jgi:hypothetical protein